MDIMFANKAPLEFFTETVAEIQADCYLKALVYTIGVCADTRRNFNRMYDRKSRSIITECINEGWQTSNSVRVTRLAFQLFTDSTPTGQTYDEHDNETSDIKECQR